MPTGRIAAACSSVFLRISSVETMQSFNKVLRAVRQRCVGSGRHAKVVPDSMDFVGVLSDSSIGSRRTPATDYYEHRDQVSCGKGLGHGDDLDCPFDRALSGSTAEPPSTTDEYEEDSNDDGFTGDEGPEDRKHASASHSLHPPSRIQDPSQPHHPASLAARARLCFPTATHG